MTIYTSFWVDNFKCLNFNPLGALKMHSLIRPVYIREFYKKDLEKVCLYPVVCRSSMKQEIPGSIFLFPFQSTNYCVWLSTLLSEVIREVSFYYFLFF